MWLYSSLVSSRGRAPRARMPCPCRQRLAGRKLFLERLEHRSLPSVNPLPIPGGLLVPNTLFGGPDVHFHQPGPADSANPNKVGGDPSTIYDFNGFVGVVRV